MVVAWPILSCGCGEQPSHPVQSAAAPEKGPVPDKTRILIDLSESPRTQFGKVSFEEQTEVQQVFSCVWGLESEVMNGGFWQYYYNTDGEAAYKAVPALEEIGARRAAEIVRHANSEFQGGVPPKDRSKRQEQLTALSETAKRHLEELSEQFIAYPDDLTVLLYDFVKRHPQEFGRQD